MKKHKNFKWSSVLLIGTLLTTIGLVLEMNMSHSYQSRIESSSINLRFARRSIRLFTEQNGRFPDSLHELNEYGEKFPDKTQYFFSPSELIAGKRNYDEHSVLDGTGGLYYNPKTGELKLNLTKPLKSYWKFYFGKKRSEVPADW